MNRRDDEEFFCNSLDRWRFRFLLALCRKIYSNNNVFKGKTILNVGVGTGRESYLFLRQSPRFYFALDKSPSHLKEAVSILQPFKQVRFLFGDAHYLPFRSQSVDIVVLSVVLHHVRFPDRCIDEAMRVAREMVIVDDAHKSKVRDLISYVLIKFKLKYEVEREENRRLTFRLEDSFLSRKAKENGFKFYTFPFYIHSFDEWFSKTRHYFFRNLYYLIVVFINKIRFLQRWGNRVVVLFIRSKLQH